MVNEQVTTIELTAGTPSTVEFSGAYPYYWVDNRSAGDVYASLGTPEAGTDGTYTIAAGSQLRISGGAFNTKLSLLGSGKVQVIASAIAAPPFQGVKKGGGYAVTGTSSYVLNAAVDYPLLGLNLYGKSTQDGTPTPDAPVDIVSVGDGGSADVKTCGKNLFDLDYFLKCKFYNKLEVSKIENGFYVKTLTDMTGKLAWICVKLDGNFINGETYTISNNTNAYEKLSLQLRNKDGTNAGFPRGYKIVYDENYDLYITCSPFGGTDTPVTAGSIATFTNIQVEVGDTATDYEPYKGSTATITTALPLCGIPVESGGNYTDSNGQQWVCDKLIYNADGTGKIIKQTVKVIFDGSDDEIWATDTSQSAVTGIDNRHRFRNLALRDNVNLKPMKISSNDTLAKIICDVYPTETATRTFFNHNGVCIDDKHDMLIYDEVRAELSVAEWKSYLAANSVTVVYQLAEPQEIELTAAEMAALRQLQTFEGVTNISNDSGAEMSVKLCTNKALSEFVYPITMGLQKQIDELKAAVLSLGGNV